MTRPRAILHVGTMKTGTSSVQASLDRNKEWLARQGMHYLGYPCRKADRIRLQVANIPNGEGIIISDEGLWHFIGDETARIAEALKGFDVTVLVYFRRPDLFVESWYSQGLKTGTGCPSFPAFERSAFVEGGLRFLPRINYLCRLFGESALRVAPYETSQLAGQDIVTDFLIRSGLAPEGSNSKTLAADGFVPITDRNISPDATQILIDTLVARFAPETDQTMSQDVSLREVLQQIARETPVSRPRLLYAAEAAAINNRHIGDFRRIQTRFGTGATASFFWNWDLEPDPARTSPLRALFDAFIPPDDANAKGFSERLDPDVVRDLEERAKSLKGRPLRPVFVMQNLAGLSGGAERVFLETIAGMAARGMEPRIVTFDLRKGDSGHGPAPVPARSVFPAMRRLLGQLDAKRQTGQAGRLGRLIKSVPDIFPITRLKWHVTHGVFALSLKRDLKTNGGDVVVAFLPPAICAGAIAAKALGLPMIASTHNVPSLDFGNSPRWDQNPIYRALARQGLRQADRVTVLLPEFVDWFDADHRNKVVVLPNPVERTSPVPASPPLREPVILGVGRLTEIKRWPLLIKAFSRIAKDLPDWRLRIHGEGPERATLEAQIAASGLADRIELCAATRDIGTQYDRASILCHPSSFEGFGLSVAEAMAHGLPAIAFADCAGVNRLIRSGQDGLLVAAGNDPVGHLAQGLLVLAQQPQIRARFGLEAQKITHRFEREVIHNHWAALISDVVLEEKGVPTSAAGAGSK